MKTDSPVSRRIVLAFLDFLNSVEPAPGTDLESLEVVKECLEEVFKLNPSSTVDQAQPGLLLNFFHSLESSKQYEVKSDDPAASSANTSSTSSAPNIADSEDRTDESHIFGVSKDELFGQFFGALEKINFFRSTLDGSDDQTQLDKATRLFHDALMEIERSGYQTIDRNILGETLKSQGNKAMQSKLYADAIELYTCAIALCENNAVYYCNRAAAYTQIQKFSEAISDCLKSIESDPNYSKAYSRLGLAYYAQGNYSDAINKGFTKALQLDPNSDSIRENNRVAEQKLKEEMQRTAQDQPTSSASHNNQEPPNRQSTGGSRNRGPPPPFTSFNNIPLSGDLAQMLINMAATASSQNTQDRQHDDSDTNGFDEPEIRIGGNISMNFGELPEEVTGAWRSVMEMFSGAAASHEQPQGDMHRGSAPDQ